MICFTRPQRSGAAGIYPIDMTKRHALYVLIACEESQAECAAWRALGCSAFSCDIQPCRKSGNPAWHILGDVTPYLQGKTQFTTMSGDTHDVPGWDLIIAHPPCTDLAISGARWFKEKQADGRQQASIEFFMKFTDLDCSKVAIENPVSIMSSIYRKPDQIIQPYQFGHPVSKNLFMVKRFAETYSN